MKPRAKLFIGLEPHSGEERKATVCTLEVTPIYSTLDQSFRSILIQRKDKSSQKRGWIP